MGNSGSNGKSFSPKSSGKIKSSESSSNMFSSKWSEGDSGKLESTNYIEDMVCKESDIQENEMKQLPLGSDGDKILLIKQQGKLYAIGNKCTHYGAPLVTGALGDGRVRCPWHGACFNIETGDIEDYPGLDSIPRYKVSTIEGQVKVRAKKSDLAANRREKLTYELKEGNPDVAVIIGGGPAGATCAESLRQEGFEGRIVMVCKEKVLPYDRVKVSKVIDLDINKILLRSQCFYDKHNIETKLGVEALSLDTKNQKVTLSNCEKLSYTSLFIATGSKPRKPDFQGVNLRNIFTIRNYTDAQALHRVLSSQCKKHVVILGANFIGMEIASYCADKTASVTIIGKYCVPLTHVFGDEIGKSIKKVFEEKGVTFITQNSICKCIPKVNNDEIVGQVELQDGRILQADIVILGIGSTFYTNWLTDSNITLLQDGSIEVDKYLTTNVPNVFAGGDIAFAPVYSANKSATIGHFALAQYHGKIAARNMCKKETPLRAIPFFWTTLFGKSYRYSGYGKSTSIKVHGSLSESKFFAYHFKDGKVIAMSSLGRDPIVSDFANYIYEGKCLSEKSVTNNPTKWMRNLPADLKPPTPECES
ncbi:PREDICTED: apoptosis-inducing factor 3 [Ceratosolen solmsi marchali]|uniref:Apoptosis-inducing factor 3 n=1 Tax=Ceratosolen solmsi marchali TaxID=326594 RepID=A0AAJ6YGB1_9HYME|nr:PREDICTED: apoptosis-inducing factor 3 [Ceratosolen solmsi marchali]XP_011497543.1 PREDICTED: apoptosis-inducing factor 3 [Ceratosolen solmsi marchali]